jgi:hypothetical protein
MAFTKRQLGPFALEAALIVGSILLAFAIDAAWESRGEHRREAELLSALRTDFERNREALAEARAQHESHRAAALRYLDVSAPGRQTSRDSIDDETLLALVSWHTYDPVLGSLGSAVASGQLTLIRDDDLRAALASWVDSVEDLNESEAVDRDHAQRFAQVAFDYVPFRSAVYRLGAEEYGPPSTASADYSGLLTSLRAENIATNRAAEIGFILGDVDRVEAELAEILDRIGERLD